MKNKISKITNNKLSNGAIEYCCDHVSNKEFPAHISLYTGKQKRFVLCKLCVNLLLGVHMKERIKGELIAELSRKFSDRDAIAELL